LPLFTVTPASYIDVVKRTRDRNESSVQVTPGSDLEVWRAAGIAVTVVERCPASRCEICGGRLATAA